MVPLKRPAIGYGTSVTAVQNTPVHELQHLSRADVEELAVELDAIRQQVLDTRGAGDAAYIRRVIRAQRSLELGSRLVLMASGYRPAWLLGTLGPSRLARLLVPEHESAASGYEPEPDRVPSQSTRVLRRG